MLVLLSYVSRLSSDTFKLEAKLWVAVAGFFIVEYSYQ